MILRRSYKPRSVVARDSLTRRNHDMARKYRVGIIGATGRGDYGHGLDRAFADAERFEVVAVADADAAGRQAAGKRLSVNRLYGDYREMLAREKPGIVSIGPRWLT